MTSQDQPDTEGMTMVMPFVVCSKEGGEYDDTAFVAGFTCGTIWAALETAKLIGAERLSYLVREPLLRQLDLFGMHFGYAVESASMDDHPGWLTVTFSSSEVAR